MVKRKRFLAMGLLIAALLIGAGVTYLQYDLRSFVRMGGTAYDRYAQILDLSGRQDVEFEKLPRFYDLRQVDLRGTGMTAAQYEQMQTQLPECEIIWQVPFQGALLELDTREVTVSSLSLEDVRVLTYLPELQVVEAETCTDYAELDCLVRTLPGVDVRYTIALGGKQWEPDSECLELDRLDGEELARNLPYLRKVNQIVLTGELPDTQSLREVEAAFSEIHFLYRLPGRQIPIGKSQKQLILSGEELGAEQVRQILALCPDAERLELRDMPLTPQEVMDICADNPELFVLWDVPFGDSFVPSDAQEVDISGQQLEGTTGVEAMLPYMPNLQKVVMCDCGISNEEMDALNQRYEDIRFVWMVHIGRVPVRTDAIFFAPVITNETVYESQMEPLKYCTDLVAIDLGHMPINTCTWAAYMPNLQYLILADTGVSDISPLANHDKLVFLEMFITPCRDYSPLLTCPNLEDLNLCYSYGSAEPVQKMTWLKRLWWDGNPYQTKALEEYLPDTECNFESGSSTGGTWRQGQRYKEQRDILGMPYLVG